MRKYIVFSILSLVLLAAAIPLYFSFTLPDKIQAQIQAGLEQMGFEAVSIRSTSKKASGLALYDIKLDKKGFGTIDSVTAQYSWTGAWRGQYISSLIIRGLKITGDINEDGRLEIAGCSCSNTNFHDFFSGIDEIDIEDSSLDLMTDMAGGINLQYNLHIQNSKRNGLDVTGQIKGSQRRLNMEAKIEGLIERNGKWRADIDIEQGKFDLPYLKATRITGKSELSGINLQKPNMVTQMAIGGLTMGGLYWHNVNATINSTEDGYDIFAGGKSAGEEGLEFAINTELLQKGYSVNGSVYIEKLSRLINYFKKNNLLSKNFNALNIFGDLEGLTLNFRQTPDTTNFSSPYFSYDISDGSGALDIKGQASVDIKDKSISANISMAPAYFSKILSENKEGHNSGFSSGTFMISGNTDIRYSPEISATGFLRVEIKEAGGRFNGLSFSGINGNLNFKDLSAFPSVNDQAFSFRLPFDKGISQKGSFQLSLSKDAGMSLKSVRLNIFEGNMVADAIDIDKNGELKSFTTDIRNIDLYNLFNALKVDGLLLSGKVRGTLPIRVKGGTLYIQDGVFTHETPGVIHFSPKQYPDFLRGTDLQTETARLLLENYHYDGFTIKVNGSLSGKVSINISAEGKNPDIFNGRSANLNLNIESDAGSLFESILENKTF